MKTGRKIMRSGISSAYPQLGLAAYFLSCSDASVEMAVCESDYGPQLSLCAGGAGVPGYHDRARRTVQDFSSSMISVVMGFVLGFVTSVPVAFLMAWYRPVRYIVEPWIQFIRNIPPLAMFRWWLFLPE